MPLYYRVVRPSRELLQQCLGFLEVYGVQPLAEPGIHLSQKLACGIALALLLPEATQAHGGPQFQGLGLLLTRHLKRLVETRFWSLLRLPLAEAVRLGDDTTLPPNGALRLLPLPQRPRPGRVVPRPPVRLLHTPQRAERDSMVELFSRLCSAARRGPGASAQYPLLSAPVPLMTSPG